MTRHPELGEVWVEFKGSWSPPTGNGLERTDTLKKAIANGFLLHSVEGRRPYWLVCSHLPRLGSSGELWLGLARAAGLFDEVLVL